VDEGVWAVDGRYVLPNGSIHGYLAILEATFTVPPLTNSGGTLGIFMRRPSGPNTVLLLAKRAVQAFYIGQRGILTNLVCPTGGGRRRYWWFGIGGAKATLR
jgi:hypothetical protein